MASLGSIPDARVGPLSSLCSRLGPDARRQRYISALWALRWQRPNVRISVLRALRWERPNVLVSVLQSWGLPPQK